VIQFRAKVGEIMAESVPPASVPPATPPVAIPIVPPNPGPRSQVEYEQLFSYFRYLVTITVGAITLILGTAGVLFYSNMKDVRIDAKDEANRVAATEAKNRVDQAFDDKNINAMILKAATDKIGTITDKMIQEQVAVRLVPIQQKIVAIGQIEDSNMRMRMAFRDGLDDLTRIMKTSTDSDIVRFANTTMTSVSRDYETRVRELVSRFNGNALSAMQNNQAVLIGFGLRPNDLHDVVQVLTKSDDLNVVSIGFAAFRQLSGENVKMFDVAAVTSWCSRNKPKCEVAEKPAPSPPPKQ
jgi:hypothetical protein